MSTSTRAQSAPPRTAYTVAEVAQSLGLPTWQIYDLVARAQLAHFRVGKHIRIPVRALDDFIANAA